MRSVATLFLSLSLATFAIAQTGQPVASRLTLRPAIAKTTVGTAATITVALTDSQGHDVVTATDISVEIQSPLLGSPMTVHIAPQSSSVSFPLIPSHGGPARVEARAKHLAPASMLVLAKPSAEQIKSFHPVTPAPATPAVHPPAYAIHVKPELGNHHPPLGAVTTAPPPPPPPQPAASQPAPTTVTLTPEILLSGDPQYDADQRQWHATVVVGLHDAENHYLPPDKNSSGKLFANLATVAPTDVTWDPTSPWSTSAVLTSSQPGQDTLRLASSLGSTELSPVNYSLPPATQIVLSAAPSVTNDGRVKVPVSVRLTDNEGNEAPAVADTDIEFRVSLGSVDPDRVIIKAGKAVPDTGVSITSARNGTATVEASGLNLKDGTANIHFDFPIRLLVMAGIGGIIGSLVRKPKSTGHFSLKHWLASTVVGVVVGVFFFVVAYLGALSLVPSFSIVAIDKVPSGNELGALLLGFLAGLVGIGIFLKDGGASGADGGGQGGQLHRVDVTQPDTTAEHH